jgi:hypothetical protein
MLPVVPTARSVPEPAAPVTGLSDRTPADNAS